MTTLPDLYAAKVAEGALTPDPAQEAVLPEFERIRADLAKPVKRGLFRKAPEPVRGLYLWGGVGRGKSMLMDMFAASSTVPTRRVHFHAFMQEVHAGLHKARQSGIEDALKPVAKAISDQYRLLAFDEMQITDITDAMIVGHLFELLFAEGVTVVTTSNRPPDDLYKDGLRRESFLPFIALMKDRMVVRELASPTDHRQGRMQGNQVYFAPNGPKARQDLDRIWQDLTQGHEAPLILQVQGRQLELPRFHNGVARASFFDLCGRMLGPADYLKLASSVRVLMIEDIPQLSRQNFNEAKRFVTLIDALYEARIKLFASAAAAPEMLYVEGVGTFEFERTASRLREMQAQDWGITG